MRCARRVRSDPYRHAGVSADFAGRCKLMALTAVPSADANSGPAYYGTSGLLAMAIKQNNNAAQRQELFDACVEARGTREQPAEVTN